MSSDIQAGDVVICVDVKTPPKRTRRSEVETLAAMAFLVKGRSYQVTYVNREGGLHLAGQPSFITQRDGYWRGRFRKIDAADEQFSKRIKAFKPVPATISTPVGEQIGVAA